MREKKFGKLFLTWLLAATMVLTLLPVGMLAADAPDEAAEDGEAVLTPVAGAEAGGNRRSCGGCVHAAGHTRGSGHADCCSHG